MFPLCLGIFLLLTSADCRPSNLIRSSRWMSSLPDNTSISQISIPGTHNSCSLFGGPFYQTQTMSLRQQLDAGIRFLDIRVRHYFNSFSIHHDVVFQELRFGRGVQNVVIDWLRQNPGEAIIMSIRDEYRGSENARTFEETFDWYTSDPSIRKYWNFNDTTPKLGDIRGKIFLFRRFDVANNRTLGLDMTKWIHDSAFTRAENDNILVQDVYKVSSFFSKPMNLKWNFIKDILNATNLTEDDTWVINFSSGSSYFALPIFVAKGFLGFRGMNSRLVSFINDIPTGRLGTIVMDFPESEDRLISYIFLRNYNNSLWLPTNN